MNFTFKRRFTETIGWIPANYDFNQKLVELKQKYDEELEHDCCAYLLLIQRFYKCATAPDFQFCYDWEDFEYLLKKERFFSAADILQVWILSDRNRLFNYKIPDENGLIPEKGAY